jgi:hypothetical protein
MIQGPKNNNQQRNLNFKTLNTKIQISINTLILNFNSLISKICNKILIL